MKETRLYLITPSEFHLADFVPLAATALDAGHVACLQLRLKNTSDEEILSAAAALLPLCRERKVVFLVNDRSDLALASGADGVHIGQEDADYQATREILGNEAVIGVTCHDSKDLAYRAAQSGADYVAFGAFFPTRTKIAKGHPDISILEDWSLTTTVPCVAIGGITPQNCGPLAHAGADFIAVTSGVWDHPGGPGEAVRAYEDALKN